MTLNFNRVFAILSLIVGFIAILACMCIISSMCVLYTLNTENVNKNGIVLKKSFCVELTPGLTPKAVKIQLNSTTDMEIMEIQSNLTTDNIMDEMQSNFSSGEVLIDPASNVVEGIDKELNENKNSKEIELNLTTKDENIFSEEEEEDDNNDVENSIEEEDEMIMDNDDNENITKLYLDDNTTDAVDSKLTSTTTYNDNLHRVLTKTIVIHELPIWLLIACITLMICFIGKIAMDIYLLLAPNMLIEIRRKYFWQWASYGITIIIVVEALLTMAYNTFELKSIVYEVDDDDNTFLVTFAKNVETIGHVMWMMYWTMIIGIPCVVYTTYFAITTIDYGANKMGVSLEILSNINRQLQYYTDNNV